MAVSGISSTAGSTVSPANTFGDLKTEDFMKLLIAELQNQDPMSPMDNQQILTQISSLTEMSANQSLIASLDSLAGTQSLGAASGMIGKTISGKVNQSPVSGVVEKVVVEGGQVYLKVGEHKVPVSNVSEIT